MHTWSALALSTRLDRLLQASGVPLQVLSVHRRACNLITPRGDLVALVTADLGHGPFHVVVEADAPFTSVCAVGEVGVLTKKEIRLPRLRVLLAESRLWSPEVRWPLLRWRWDRVLALTVQALQARAPDLHVSLDTLADAHVTARVRQVAHALVAGDSIHAREALAHLVGLGPGLTPAGDDAIVGLLAGWRALHPEQDPTWPDLRGWVLAASRGTHRISRAWLEAAAHNAFAEPWHHLADALTDDDPHALTRALTRLRHQGATSGYYGLVGFQALLDAWQRERLHHAHQV